MSMVVDIIRQFWLPGLNDVSGTPTKGIGAWICNEDYQIYEALLNDEFVLSVSNEKDMLSAFAHDCSRMGVASFESISSIVVNNRFPKSIAWGIIQLYYSAFFASHSILRMLGISCTQVDKNATRSVMKIADLFGNANGKSISQGYYSCTYDPLRKKLYCKKLSSGGGVHELFWSVFYKRMNALSGEILIRGSYPSNDQQVSVQLDDLCHILSHGHLGNGNWLSIVRNDVNYRHLWGTWFPYKDSYPVQKKFYEYCNLWKSDPMTLNLRLQSSNDLLGFATGCCFIIGLCRALSIEMMQRCSTGKSFHRHSSIAFLNLLAK
jgi:hypothetical protein